MPRLSPWIYLSKIKGKKHIIIIYLHRVGAVNYLSYIVNIVTASCDARASAVMASPYFSRDILVSAPGGLHF